MNRLFVIVFVAILLSGCAAPSASPLPTDPPPPGNTPLPSATLTATATFTATATDTPTTTFTPTLTPTLTQTPTWTFTPSPTLTPTYALPRFTVTSQAHCRYGPASAFLHAGDLYPGDTGTVGGRYQNSAWLYVKLDKLDYWCWVSPSVVEVVGDISKLVYQQVRLPGPSVLYNPPAYVRASRNGNEVTVTWAGVPMTEDDDRGYLLDVFVCQNSINLWSPVSLPNQYSTSYTFTDEPGCANSSGGVLYAVEKHGYILPPLKIDWPAP